MRSATSSKRLQDKAHPFAEGRSTPRRRTLRVQPRVNYNESNTQFDDIDEERTSPAVARPRVSRSETFDFQDAEREPEPKPEAPIASEHEKSSEIPESQDEPELELDTEPEPEPETSRHLILPSVIPSSENELDLEFEYGFETPLVPLHRKLLSEIPESPVSSVAAGRLLGSEAEQGNEEEEEEEGNNESSDHVDVSHCKDLLNDEQNVEDHDDGFKTSGCEDLFHTEDHDDGFKINASGIEDCSEVKGQFDGFNENDFNGEESSDWVDLFADEDRSDEEEFSGDENLGGSNFDDEDRLDQIDEPTGLSLDSSAVWRQGKVRPFDQLLREAITYLVTWARENYISSDEYMTAPIAPGFWGCLRNATEDELMDMYLPAITDDVKSLFERKSWSVDDLIGLVSGYQPGPEQGPMGLYANFFLCEHRGKERVMGYVGSTDDLHRRVNKHLNMARNYTPKNLPKNEKGSRHYMFLCREGVQPNIAPIAIFEEPIERGYLNLLEGIFMILFRTISRPGYAGAKYNRPEEMYDFIYDMARSLMIETSSIWATNLDWPIRKQFPHPAYSKESQCVNYENCKKMTYPNVLMRNFEYKEVRIAFISSDPSQGFLCPCCYGWRRHHNKQLPDKATCESLVALLASGRQKEGKICADCGKVDVLASKYSAPRHVVFSKSSKEFLCYTCYRWRLRNKGQVPDESIYRARQKEGRICEICEKVAVPGLKYHDQGYIRFNRSLNKYICNKCNNAIKKDKGRIDRGDKDKCGNDIGFCHNCKILRIPGAKRSQSGYISFTKRANMALCNLCRGYFNSNGRHRPHVDRGDVSFCHNCKIPRIPDAKYGQTGHITFSKRANMALCKRCLAYFKNNGRLRPV